MPTFHTYRIPIRAAVVWRISILGLFWMSTAQVCRHTVLAMNNLFLLLSDDASTNLNSKQMVYKRLAIRFGCRLPLIPQLHTPCLRLIR